MAKSLIYVNKEMIVGLAAPYLGSEIEVTKKISVAGGFNWIIRGTCTVEEQKGILVQVRDMSPETVACELTAAMQADIKFDSVDRCTEQLSEWGKKDDNVGKLIAVSGVLNLPNISTDKKFNPFAPQAIEVSTFSYYGTECFACELTGDAVKLPVYFDKEALQLIGYCNNKKVEIIGPLGWVPYYDAGRNRSINSILKGAVVWIE